VLFRSRERPRNHRRSLLASPRHEPRLLRTGSANGNNVKRWASIAIGGWRATCTAPARSPSATVAGCSRMIDHRPRGTLARVVVSLLTFADAALSQSSQGSTTSAQVLGSASNQTTWEGAACYGAPMEIMNISYIIDLFMNKCHRPSSRLRQHARLGRAAHLPACSRTPP